MKLVKAACATTIWLVMVGVALGQNGQSSTEYNGPAPTRAEDYNWYADGCPSLQKSALPEIVEYLDSTTPDSATAVCVTYAINKVADKRYQPAIPALVKLLDFQRPDLPYEHYWKTTHILPDKFPARTTLEMMGMSAVPALVQAIGAEATNTAVRSNAVHTLLLIYGRDVQLTYGAANAILRLKEGAAEASDNATRERFDSGVREALESCALWLSNRPEQTAACRQAAEKGTLPDAPAKP